ncbi:hypothetical protein DAPPUDRAFT_329872 [Daphnia pulex]|uniref:Uncharacterized protein n=1 Tax=Daphnia pulex TaxID=6669 RepID=E9HHV8_DAPPU|nr:hypothetical protein DAPPUDRAFT_329872 [Daphnia pulex]|eukprot:EFX68697.1 hypothetical protein DAPPUDRAFT_329872 [Daphnia pulex]
MKDIPRIIKEAMQEILTKDFPVNVVKSAFPTASAGWIATGRVGQAEGMGDIERANVAILQYVEEDMFKLQTKPNEYTKVTKNLVMGLFKEGELMTSTLTGNPKKHGMLPNVSP